MELRDRAIELDFADELKPYRERFATPDERIYLSGHSLGRAPLAARHRLHEVVDREWGRDLTAGWATWMGLARQVGDLLADVIGVAKGEVVLSDSTSVNLYKLASAALDARPGRETIVTSSDNFPSDLYVLQGLAAARGMKLCAIDADPRDGVSVADVVGAMRPDVALVALSHVTFRSGARADLFGVTAAVHDAGALMLWDVSHSAGVVTTPLRESGADLAVGCTYKYLNGGPGGPAFLFVRSDLQAELRQPIWGWFGQRDQFAFGLEYDPVDGVERFLVGTPQVLAGYAVLEGVRVTAEAGINAIAKKAAALTDYAIELADSWLTPHGAVVATPRLPERRGATVCLRHPAARRIVETLRSFDVVVDFRAPDVLRIGLAPLYIRFGDVYNAMSRLQTVVQNVG